MSHVPPKWCAYPSRVAFFGNHITELPVIPTDWTLNITNVASEWVEQQFLAHIADRPLVESPPKLDVATLLSCGQLALCILMHIDTRVSVFEHLPQYVVGSCLWNIVKLDINIVCYNEALAK
jgi:hypothetical protein